MPCSIKPVVAIIEVVSTRELIVWAAVALSGITSFLYLLIGVNAASLGGISREEQRSFGLPASAVFAGGAVVAAVWDVRWIWIVGTVGLALIIGMYFSLASQRDPRYETWGILIRAVQVPLLVVLLYLAVTGPK